MDHLPAGAFFSSWPQDPSPRGSFVRSEMGGSWGAPLPHSWVTQATHEWVPLGKYEWGIFSPIIEETERNHPRHGSEVSEPPKMLYL